MATYGKKLLDSEGNIILPKTRSSLVYMDDNSTVEDTINKIINGTTVVGKATYATSAGSAVDQTARDNASAAQTTANNAMPKSGGQFGNTVGMNESKKFTGFIFRNINIYSGPTPVATNGLVCYRA